MRLQACLTLCSLLLSQAFAQDDDDSEDYFINPPESGEIHDYSEDPVYSIGDTLHLQWESDYDTMSLVLWQNDNSSLYQMFYKESARSTYSWEVDIDGIFSLDDGNVFFFQLFDEGGSGDRFSSHYFNITDDSATSSSATTSITTSSTSTATSSATSSSAATSASSTPSTSSTPESSSGGLSSSATVGIGVGVGVGAVCLLAGFALGFWLRRRSKSHHAEKEVDQSVWSGQGAYYDGAMPGPAWNSAAETKPEMAAALVSELGDGRYHHELPATVVETKGPLVRYS